MTHILDMFRASPFEPLYTHRLRVRECTDLVRPLFMAILDGHEDTQEDITNRIIAAERQADLLKVEVRRVMPKGIFLPVNREDLLRYLKIQDDLADAVQDIAVLASFKKLQTPDKLREPIIAYVETVLNVCRLADEATNHLRPLVEKGFKGENVRQVLELADKAELAETAADHEGTILARQLFSLEEEMKTTDLLLWSKILDKVGKLADYAEKTGEWLRNMLQS